MLDSINARRHSQDFEGDIEHQKNKEVDLELSNKLIELLDKYTRLGGKVKDKIREINSAVANGDTDSLLANLEELSRAGGIIHEELASTKRDLGPTVKKRQKAEIRGQETAEYIIGDRKIFEEIIEKIKAGARVSFANRLFLIENLF